MSTGNETPRIYVACLSSYNDGKLVGAWIDCDQDAEDVLAEISESINGEEWAIHDSENWHGYTVDEYDNIEDLCLLAAAFSNHGPWIVPLVDNAGSIQAAIDAADNDSPFEGEFDSLEDWAENYFESTGELDKSSTLARYFDYERFARDCELSGDIWTAPNQSGGIYVFRAY